MALSIYFNSCVDAAHRLSVSPVPRSLARIAAAAAAALRGPCLCVFISSLCLASFGLQGRSA